MSLEYGVWNDMTFCFTFLFVSLLKLIGVKHSKGFWGFFSPQV